MKKIFLKIIPSLLIITIIMGTMVGILAKPEKAQSAGAAAVVWQYIQESLDKIARDLTSKHMINIIVNQTLDWIQGKGEPKFISDLQEALGEAAEGAYGEFISGLDLSASCFPFSNLTSNNPSAFSDSLRCTLNDVVDNIDDFNNDFTAGGWAAWGKLIGDMQNNPAGFGLLMINQAITEANAATEAAAQEASSGGGYQSEKKCVGGGLTQEEWEEESAGSPSTAYMQKDINGEYCNASRMEIVTPASTIATTISEALTADINWSSGVESWMSVLVAAVIDRLIQGGLSNMSQAANTEYTDSLIRKSGQTLDMLADYNSAAQEILPIKQQTLANYEWAFAQINAFMASCPGAISDEQFANIVSSTNILVDRFTGEVSDYQAIIDGSASLITEINAALAITDREAQTEALTTAFENVSTFIGLYPTGMISEDAKTKAEEELVESFTAITNTQSLACTGMAQ